ncbi:hypothetical protein ACOSQ2_017950 [Xanthoceras sorbifolium]
MATQQQQQTQLQEGGGAGANGPQLVFIRIRNAQQICGFLWSPPSSTSLQLNDPCPCSVISGSLSVVSIFSVLLPRRLGPLIFIPWTVISIIIVAYHVHADSISNACHKLHKMIMDIISKLSATCNSIEQQGLPV